VLVVVLDVEVVVTLLVVTLLDVALVVVRIAVLDVVLVELVEGGAGGGRVVSWSTSPPRSWPRTPTCRCRRSRAYPEPAARFSTLVKVFSCSIALQAESPRRNHGHRIRAS